MGALGFCWGAGMTMTNFPGVASSLEFNKISDIAAAIKFSLFSLGTSVSFDF